ncbi:AbrB/MazE/SpoVT family DNA-binding domain-containing protein [Hathewaya massiliensis]|uniref:AbrB/MazE/SpoVT family DNA-binding domain-containing protein n=1 Tax=Hathewaya massiliensis TaxID=1964382 RepID=UPI00115B2181|nr:AbrB/MazE/SpoVT family DNA-binding domain-containing protein [Hathewaya massiliensis]
MIIEKDLKLYMNKGGSGSVSARVTLPIDWVRALGIEDSTSIPAKFEDDKIIIFKKPKGNPKIIKEIKGLIKKYNEHQGEKVFLQEFSSGECVTSTVADEIEVVEKNDCFNFLFKLKERELHGADIYYSNLNICTETKGNKFILKIK